MPKTRRILIYLATVALANLTSAAWIYADDNTEILALLELRTKLLAGTQGHLYLKSPWVTTSPQAEKSEQSFAKIQGWKEDIITTVFWIGEKPAKNNPVPNNKSSWDTAWEKNYGGYDCPKNRIGFRPAGFIPNQNPFYIALPYNDIGMKGTKPEARSVIPWFEEEFERNGKSVVKGRWIAIRHKGKIAYAQWEDTGPYRTNHWQYVFGNERPTPNRNGGAGLDVSPAVRDYLGLKGKDKTDWVFVDLKDVPRGPWTKYGKNNPFSPQYAKRGSLAEDETKLASAKRIDDER